MLGLRLSACRILAFSRVDRGWGPWRGPPGGLWGRWAGKRNQGHPAGRPGPKCMEHAGSSPVALHGLAAASCWELWCGR